MKVCYVEVGKKETVTLTFSVSSYKEMRALDHIIS